MYSKNLGFAVAQLFTSCKQLVNNVYFISAKTPNEDIVAQKFVPIEVERLANIVAKEKT